MTRLINNNYRLYDSSQCRVSILTDLSLSLLLPVEERLSASEMLKQLKKLAPYFSCSSTNEYRLFISDLLAQSSLKLIVNHGFPSPITSI